jgi:hypothetical protein
MKNNRNNNREADKQSKKSALVLWSVSELWRREFEKIDRRYNGKDKAKK